MNINIKGTNLELTADVREYLTKRLHAFEKFMDKDDTSVVCDVELARSTHHQQGNVFRAEVTMHTRRGVNRAEAEGETIEEAIDGVKSTILRELRREKRKEGHLLRRGGAKLKGFTQSLSERGVQLRDFVIRRKKK
ncbi:MAG TPA: ribosome-associated translation inhibitor RaiA [Candidatus Nanoarchaeia archaeon]|nr:ribosome-associated translation inhibitor RaiA [Candidatus Nanoarchaeia archaeon]